MHRDFAQVAIWQDGLVRQAGRIYTTPEALRPFADSLAASDEVALEATGNTHAIVRLLEQHVAARVVVSSPQKTRAIAEAKSRSAGRIQPGSAPRGVSRASTRSAFDAGQKPLRSSQGPPQAPRSETCADHLRLS